MEIAEKRHIGIVTQIVDTSTIKVKIARNQCDGCQLGRLCNVSQEDELEVSVNPSQLSALAVGDHVQVEERQDAEVTAIWLCLVIPCMLFLVSVITVTVIFSPLEGCLAGVVAMIAYFGGFYLLKKKKNNRIIFTVKKL